MSTTYYKWKNYFSTADKLCEGRFGRDGEMLRDDLGNRSNEVGMILTLYLTDVIVKKGLATNVS